MQFNRSNLAWLVVGLFVGGMAIAIAFTLTQQLRPAPIHITPPAPSATPLPTPLPGPIQIYITGEVAHPDVYELPAGSILKDAVLAAGGFSETANSEVINLAMPLSNGMHVHVPDSDSEPVLTLVVEGAATVASSTAGPVNINTATLEELDRLPGIGPGIGQRVIDYREANGPFASIEDIMNVSGIGQVKYEQLKELIIVE